MHIYMYTYTHNLHTYSNKTENRIKHVFTGREICQRGPATVGSVMLPLSLPSYYTNQARVWLLLGHPIVSDDLYCGWSLWAVRPVSMAQLLGSAVDTLLHHSEHWTCGGSMSPPGPKGLYSQR